MLKDVDVKGVVTELKKSIATVQVTGGAFTYDGAAKPASGFAYGTGGVSDVLNPAVTFVYKNAAGTVLPGAPVNAGAYTIDAAFAGNSLYKAAAKSAVITIGKADAAVNATGGEFTYDGAAKPATAFAYGIGGAADKLTPEVTYVYKDAAGTVLAGAPVNAGTYTVEASFAGNNNYKPATASTTVTINTVAITVAANALTKQWSDPDPELTYTIITGSLVGSDTFAGSLGRVAGEELGAYNISQGTLALSSNYLVTIVPNALTIAKEDARATFTGSQFVSTSCATCSGATVTLSATIRDISVTSEAAGDVHPGDISKAMVRFVDRETNAAISGWLPVMLVNNADKLTGTVVYNWVTTTGASDAADYTIGIEVDNGHYFRNNTADNVVVMVAKPLNDFVVGAGYIPSSGSNGQYAADQGTGIQFATNVKYNKSGKNLQGRINVILSRTEADGIVHVYQLKGNVMNSLATNTTDPANKQAAFTGKAAMVDITDVENPVPVAGNLTVQMDLTDRGTSGTNDGIAITVWANEGALLLSSNWTGTATTRTILGGGNISISGGSAASGEVASVKVAAVGIEAAAEQPVVQVYPVPSNTDFTLVLQGTATETAEITVFDLAGRKVEQFKGVTGQSIRFGDKLTYGTYLVEIRQGGKRTTIKVLKH